MKENIYKLLLVVTLGMLVTACGEEAKVETKASTDAVKDESITTEEKSTEPKVQNEGLYDLKSSINSAIGDSIEEDIRDAVENQVENNNK